MKTKIPSRNRFAAALLSLVCAATVHTTFAATTATTNPVGFITMKVDGGGTVATPAVSFIGPTLTGTILWQGSIDTISGTNITVVGTPWTTDQFNGPAGSHYVEIISTATPALSGTLSDITATTTNSITTAQATGAAAGDIIVIRKDLTIASVFGTTNQAGLLATTDQSTADEIVIFSGATPSAYYYYHDPSDTSSDGWYDIGGNPAGDVTIAPNEGMMIKRKTSAPLSIAFPGTVKAGNTQMPVLSGFNLLGVVSAKGLTLGTSGLYTGNSATGVYATTDQSTADEVLIFSSGGTVLSSYYYYHDPSDTSSDGWYDIGGNPSDTVAIAVGSSVILKRKIANAFNWVQPAPSSF